MYFRQVVRKNPTTSEIGDYYRLVESYRNENDRVCVSLHTPYYRISQLSC
jgi:hypothetical protein